MVLLVSDCAGQAHLVFVIFEGFPGIRVALGQILEDVENDRGAEKEYLEKGNGRRGVPLIDVGGKILRGYSPRSLDDALDRGAR